MIDYSKGTDEKPIENLYKTMGITHVEGTNRNVEIEVAKIVMVREGILMKLRFLVHG